MKLIVELDKKVETIKYSDGVILALKNYAVLSNCYYTIEEIEEIVKENPKKEIFVKINKNLFNDEIEKIKEILIKLNKIKIKGIFFYDLAILQLKKELELQVDLVWNQEHMVNNYKTINYYYDKGVEYSLLSREITLDEILEMVGNCRSKLMVEVVGCGSIAFSKRKLISNYYKDLDKDTKKEIEVVEKVSKKKIKIKEESTGTGFYLNEIVNGTSIIKSLYDAGISYIIMRESGIEYFLDLVLDTKKYIEDKCLDDKYINKYKKLGDNTNFFFNKTIYKVKKNG